MLAALIYPHQLFPANRRMAVMTAQWRRMGTRLDAHRKIAASSLEQLHDR